ncbi:MAG: hypothetical protein ACK5LO_07555 [Leucobacter sp.]
MATLEKRVQVLFDPEDYALIIGEARASGVSVGAFIRQAVNDRVSAARTSALASWQELWNFADAAPVADTGSESSAGSLDWDEMKANYEDEMDPAWRLSHDVSGQPRHAGDSASDSTAQAVERASADSARSHSRAA